MMNNFTKEIIDTYAENLLFRLSEEENALVLNEFVDIEERMNLINKIPNLSSVEPMSHPFPLDDVILREDIHEESLSVDDAFKNAHKVTNREVEVPRVVA